MKRALTTFGLITALFAMVTLSSRADDNTWTGWISDSHCGAKGMSAGHKACAETCVKTKGASWVFVNEKDQKVYTIANQSMVHSDTDLGHEVTVTGTMNNDGSLKVNSIAEAKKM